VEAKQIKYCRLQPTESSRTHQFVIYYYRVALAAYRKEREMISETQYVVDESTHTINIDKDQFPLYGSGARRRFRVKPKTSAKSMATKELTCELSRKDSQN
jgi:hypothetical protein